MLLGIHVVVYAAILNKHMGISIDISMDTAMGISMDISMDIPMDGPMDISMGASMDISMEVHVYPCLFITYEASVDLFSVITQLTPYY